MWFGKCSLTSLFNFFTKTHTTPIRIKTFCNNCDNKTQTIFVGVGVVTSPTRPLRFNVSTLCFFCCTQGVLENRRPKHNVVWESKKQSDEGESNNKPIEQCSMGLLFDSP